MIPAMSDKKRTSALSSDLARLETYYDIGDYQQAKALAKSLLDNDDLENADRKRIDKVLGAMKTDPGAIVAFVITFLLMLYLVIRYGT